MSEDFRVGDIIVCINAEINPCLPEDNTLTKGKFYKVQAFEFICEGVHPLGVGKHYGVWLEGVRSKSTTGSYHSSRFKHLPKADDTFINQMRSLKPAKEKTRV